jgi:hypothetical protein
VGKEQIQGHLYLRPKKFNAYVRMIIFFTRDSPPDAETTVLLTGLAQSHPLNPLAFEVVFLLSGAVRNRFPRSRAEVRADCFQIDAMKNDLLRKMSLFTVQIQSGEQGQLSPGDHYTAVVEVVQMVGDCKNRLCQLLAVKLAKPISPDEITKDMFQFERARRRGLTRQEMTSLLRILMVWRSATDALHGAAEGILRIICPHFNELFHRFTKDQLEDILQKTKQKPAVTRVQELFTPMREVLGDWLPDEERILKGKYLPAHLQKQSIAVQSPAAIAFVGIELHHIVEELLPADEPAASVPAR